jgi:hypothetical protein
MHFSTTLIAAGLAAASAKHTLTEVAADYSLAQFVQDFKVPASASWDAEELASRQQLFAAEVAKVQAHNAAGHSYKIGLNRFSAMTTAEKRAFLGHNKAVRQAHTEPRHELPSGLQMKRVQDLPASVDWRETPNVVSSVKDQVTPPLARLP